MTKSYILDTNVLLQDSNIFSKFLSLGDVLISSNVVKELDTFKNNYDTMGRIARSHMRFLNELIEKNDLRLVDGVVVEGCPNRLFSFSVDKKVETADDEIVIFCRDFIQDDELGNFVVVTNDINLKLRLNSDKSVHVRTQSYTVESFESDYKIFSGYREATVPAEVVCSVYGKSLQFADIKEHCPSVLPNEFVCFKSDDGTKSSALVRYEDYPGELVEPIRVKFPELERYGITPRNREQIFALNLLLDPAIEVVTIIGPAGSGKTLLALSAGLAQINCSGAFPEKKSKKTAGVANESVYKKIVVSRPIQPMGKDIGFLPGSIQEKMAPWIQPIVDNLEYLLGGDTMLANDVMTSGVVQVEAPTFIRGRTINNAFVIVDEVQNLRRHELKTIMTRVGEGSKIILTGDIEQIDNESLDELSNGLTYVVEKFKHYPMAGHVTMVKGERSRVATLASKIL